MKILSNDLAQLLREIYLIENVNFTTRFPLSIYQEGQVVNLEEYAEPDFVKIIKHYSNRIGSNLTSEYSQSLSFTADFNFKRDNRSVEQLIYGQNRVVDTVSKFISEKKNARVASLGIGDGKISSRYVEELDGEIFGIDIHNKFLTKAKRLIPHLKTITCDFNTQLPWAIPDNSLDVVECTLTAHHIENLDAFFRQIHSVININGKFIYLDVIDKTKTESEMLFNYLHQHPPYHGVEFFRTHEEVQKVMKKYFQLIDYERIGPGLVFIIAEKRG